MIAKIRVWNCQIERLVTVLSRAAIRVSTGCCSWALPLPAFTAGRCPGPHREVGELAIFGSAAATQEAGFVLACVAVRKLRPDLASWRETSNTVSRALALIADGALDGDDSKVAALAERLGIGEQIPESRSTYV